MGSNFLSRPAICVLTLVGVVLVVPAAQAQSPYNDPFFGRPQNASRPAVVNSPVGAPLVAPGNTQPAVAVATPSDQPSYDRPYAPSSYDRRSYDRPYDGRSYDRQSYDRPDAPSYDRPYAPGSNASGAPVGLQRAVATMSTAPSAMQNAPAPDGNGEVPRGRITPYGVVPPSSGDHSPFAASTAPATPPASAYPPIPKADVPKAPEAQFAQCAGNAADATTDSIIAACSAIIAAGRDNRMAEVYADRARAWHKAAQYKAAVADFDQSLRLKADDADALQGRCMSRAVLGDLQKALADCNQALKLKPDDMAALEARGFTFRKLRDFKQSLADYDAVLAREPKRASALFGRGAAKLDDGDRGGNLDIKQAKDLQSNVAQEYGRYGVYH